MLKTIEKIVFPFSIENEKFICFEQNEHLFIHSDGVFKKWNRLTQEVVAQSQPLGVEIHSVFGNKLFVYDEEQITVFSLDTLEKITSFTFSPHLNLFQTEDLVYFEGTLFLIVTERVLDYLQDNGDLVDQMVEGKVHLFSLKEKEDGTFDEPVSLGNWPFENEYVEVSYSFTQKKIVLGFEKSLVVIDKATEKTSIIKFDDIWVNNLSSLSENKFLVTYFGSRSSFEAKRKNICWSFDAETLQIAKCKEPESKDIDYEFYNSILRIKSPMIDDISEIKINQRVVGFFFSAFEMAIYLFISENNALRVNLKALPAYVKRDYLQFLLERSKRKEDLGMLSKLNTDVLEKIFLSK